MIPIEALHSVRTIVTHDNCPDGYASAMVLHDALPDARVVFVRHGTADHRLLAAEPGMLFCDFSPPAARVQEFRDAGAIVLDHHKTARELAESFPLHVFADEVMEPGVSGAVLAYREVWRPVVGHWNVPCEVEDFATLAGIRDTWQTKDPRWLEACAQAEALRFWPKETLLAVKPLEWSGLMAIGPVIVAKNRERDKRTLEGSHRFISSLGRVVCFQGLETSDIAETLAADADLVAGWSYSIDAGVKRMQISLRSREDVDVAALAKRYGGGGHTKAAGFTLSVADDDPNPWARIEQLLGAP